ncbi:MAG: histidine phosphatase family protein [Burkholderiaceae bacterium]
MQATRIIAVRHGETHWNVDSRIQGQRDIPLNDKGRWQAQRLARALAAREPITAVYSSDLARARETAQSIADVAGLQVLSEPALRERGFGSFEGRTFKELEAEVPHETARWRRREADWAPEGGESLKRVRARVEQAIHALGARHVGEQIVLVSHGGVLDAMYRVAAGLAIDAPRSWILGNASINRLLWTPQGLTLVGWSDTAHLDDVWTDETTV